MSLLQKTMTGPTCGLLTVLAVAHLLVPIPVMAKTKVLILQTQSDALGDTERAAATTLLRDALSKYPAFTLLPTPEGDLFEIMLELECTDLDTDCLVKMGKKYGAAQVLFSKAEPDGGKVAVEMSLVSTRKGKKLKQEKATAPDKSQLTASLGKLVVNVFGSVPVKKVKKLKPVLIRISSNVSGASVRLNGEVAGKTPFRIRLKPGRYKVAMSKDGFVTVQDEFVVGKKAQSVKFEMEKQPKVVAKPVDPTKTEPKRNQPKIVEAGTPFYKTWWFWTAIGVGVAGVVTTAVLLSQDDDPVEAGILHFNISDPQNDPLVVKEAQE